MTPAVLGSLKELKTRGEGERVSFRAQVLRFWEVGGLRMVLAGDESALVRIEIGEVLLEEGRSYEFRGGTVRTYPGGWHSLVITEESTVSALEVVVPISQSEEYIERTYKILSGIQRKKGREAGRLSQWRHPHAKRDE